MPGVWQTMVERVQTLEQELDAARAALRDGVAMLEHFTDENFYPARVNLERVIEVMRRALGETAS